MSEQMTVDCPDTNYADLVGVACPQCGEIFPEEHKEGCGILWPMNGVRMTTPKVAVREPIPNHGPCAVCGNDVIDAYPWWTNNPTQPGNKGKPLHEECRGKWDSMAVQVKTSPAPAPVESAYAYGDYEPAPLTKDKSASLQSADDSIRSMQARARIAKNLGVAAAEYASIAPDQTSFEDYGRAIQILTQIALNGKDADRDVPMARVGTMKEVPIKVEGPSVFVGRPYCGEVDDGAAVAAYSYPSLNPDTCLRITVDRHHSSALCYGFNRCWAAMFCHARFPFDYFVLHHQDIEPEGPWLDILVEEAEKGGFDVMHALSPIKDNRGLTSTAYGSLELDWHVVRRITLREKDELLPETFGIEEVVKALGADGIPGTPVLLNNTGVMLIKVKERRLQLPVAGPGENPRMGPFAVGVPEAKRGLWPWCFGGFRMHDRITFGDGFAKAEFLSEDWDSGRWFARHGMRVGATRRINLGHYGRTKFQNVWDKGQLHDEAFMQRVKLHAAK